MADIYEDACVVNPASFSDKKGASLDLSSGGDDKTELSSSESDDVSTAPDVDDRHDYIPGIGMATANQSRARPCPVLNVISFLLLLLICCLLAVVVSMYLAVQQSINQGQEKMGKNNSEINRMRMSLHYPDLEELAIKLLGPDKRKGCKKRLALLIKVDLE
uniref:Uncharacterized protein n=1 Tax=Branchiostoma floridae TaxID=7739 RepID=C3YSI9_BRAFL|eukprot:XP_002600678.1 hypothetical protein BRAFLDRAFT_67742 [Branchiostoma floridae]